MFGLSRVDGEEWPTHSKIEWEGHPRGFRGIECATRPAKVSASLVSFAITSRNNFRPQVFKRCTIDVQIHRRTLTQRHAAAEQTLTDGGNSDRA